MFQCANQIEACVAKWQLLWAISIYDCSYIHINDIFESCFVIIVHIMSTSSEYSDTPLVDPATGLPVILLGSKQPIPKRTHTGTTKIDSSRRRPKAYNQKKKCSMKNASTTNDLHVPGADKRLPPMVLDDDVSPSTASPYGFVKFSFLFIAVHVCTFLILTFI